MPYQISQQDGKFCVVKKSDGKVVKCHPTEKLAKLHLTALYANEPSASKKSVGYGMLKSLIEERVEEIKGCGANKPGGGGFAAGNTCARGGGNGITSSKDKGIKEGERVKIDKRYGGGSGEVTGIFGSFLTVQLRDKDISVHEADVTRIKK